MSFFFFFLSKWEHNDAKVKENARFVLKSKEKGASQQGNLKFFTLEHVQSQYKCIFLPTNLI